MLQVDLDFITDMAKWLYKGGPVLDVGASTIEFRKREKFPYDLKPLFDRGAYYTFDVKDGNGVDYVGDAHKMAENFQWFGRWSFIICTNLLEHVRRPWVVAEQIYKIMKPGGIVVATVPWEYPPHPDPVDMWRMSEGALQSLFNPYFIMQATGSKFVPMPLVSYEISVYAGMRREKAVYDG